jgi:hypothetical protein
VDGVGGQSCAYFIRSFFPVFPYLVITFCYVMIIRKIKESRKNVFTENPLLERIKVPDEERSSGETGSEIVLTENSIASTSKMIST